MTHDEVRLVSTPHDSRAAATLLDAFSREFDAPTPGPAAIDRRLSELVGEPTTFALLIGRRDAEPLGIAVVTLRTNVWHSGWVGMLDELYVVPSRRNRGLGTMLLRTAEAELVSRGGQVMEINVDGEDVDAQRFYARHGYVDHDVWSNQPSKMYFRELG